MLSVQFPFCSAYPPTVPYYFFKIVHCKDHRKFYNEDISISKI